MRANFLPFSCVSKTNPSLNTTRSCNATFLQNQAPTTNKTTRKAVLYITPKGIFKYKSASVLLIFTPQPVRELRFYQCFKQFWVDLRVVSKRWNRVVFFVCFYLFLT